MQLSTSEAVKLMRKLGLKTKECSHHLRGVMVVDGRDLFAVHCSFGCKDLPDGVPHRFRRSLHLSAEEFEVLRSCRMSREDYIALLRQKGVA
jgi:hypothetical protein